jgi:ribose 5-phosphate isomerase RpiB
MRVAIAFSHRGVSLRASATSELVALGHEVLDLGADAGIPPVDDVDRAMNVLCLGAEIVGKALAVQILHAFPDAGFDAGDSEIARLAQVEALDLRSLCPLEAPA